MKIMVVESPNKVKTIEKVLGKDWKVVASAGHIRDLPVNNLGVDTTNFAMQYEFLPRKKSKTGHFPGGKDRVDRIRKAMGGSQSLVLAMDPDREGEAIAWHIKESLRLRDDQCERVTFDAIDKSSIEAALQAPRRIDMNLVHAQEARRALDRLVGYLVSPLMAAKLEARVSAGRVQSPALRFVVEREREIRNFKPVNHFGARLHFDGRAWTADWVTKPFLPPGTPYLTDRTMADVAATCRAVTVAESKSGKGKEAPPAPFTTSTLLQAASVSLKFSPEETAGLAQKLFEGGHITYHRTDSTNFSPETLGKLRGYLQEAGFAVTPNPRTFKSKSGAQEAHEAIRPKSFELEDQGDDDRQRALYNLIRLRALASQMPDAIYNVNKLVLAGEAQGQTFHWRANGRVLVEAGWRALTGANAELDTETGDKDTTESASGKVPPLEVGTTITAEHGEVLEKVTKPPRRYTKATLIKKLDDEGIGRPSTYPAIMKNISDKGYVEEKKRLLHATNLGERLIDALIQSGFSFVDPGFTRDLEEQLDEIAQGKAQYTPVVKRSYELLDQEAGGLGGLSAAASGGSVTADGKSFDCPECGAPMRRINGRKGAFWGCSRYREGCKTTMDDQEGKPVPRPEDDPSAPKVECPDCGAPMRLRKGKKGAFWGCSKYPDCRQTMEDDNGKPVPRENTE